MENQKNHSYESKWWEYYLTHTSLMRQSRFYKGSSKAHYIGKGSIHQQL
jgi:CDP-glycerol glycerophosphotransferase (TagB/SpsB family)